MEGKKKAFKYGIRLQGLWGRNRKAKSQFLDLLDENGKVLYSDSPLPLEEIKPRAIKLVAEMKLKQGKYEIREYPVELEEREAGGSMFTSEIFELFSDKLLHTEEVQ